MWKRMNAELAVACENVRLSRSLARAPMHNCNLALDEWEPNRFRCFKYTWDITCIYTAYIYVCIRILLYSNVNLFWIFMSTVYSVCDHKMVCMCVIVFSVPHISSKKWAIQIKASVKLPKKIPPRTHTHTHYVNIINAKRFWFHFMHNIQFQWKSNSWRMNGLSYD